MSKHHVIYVPFIGVGINRVFSQEWLADRIEIFKNHTYKSLLNQTNKDFVLVLSFRPEDVENPLLDELNDYLKKQIIQANFGPKFMFTFDGLLYHDDKNAEANKTLKQRLFNSLERIGPLVKYSNISGGNWIYLTRIDSDDMFHKDVVQLIQDQEPFEGALTLQLGNLYNKDTGEVAEWNPLTNPPFHTLMFKRETFFDPEKHLALYEGFKSHEDIARLKHKVLWRGDNRMDRLYTVLVHNPSMHISTNWDHPFKGKPLDKSVLKDFGI